MKEDRPPTRNELAKKIGDRLRAQGFIVHDGHPSTVSAPPQPDAAKTNTGANDYEGVADAITSLVGAAMRWFAAGGR